MTTIALNNLLTYIQSLNLTTKNREWLAARLIEPQKKEKNALDLAIDDIKQGRVISYNSVEDLIEDI